MKLITIIIPNWNGAKLIEECIDSLIDQTDQDFDILVVDNNSSDDSLQLLEKYQNVQVLSLDNNYGFGVAINKGVEKIKTDWFISLNNDTRADRNWIRNLKKTLALYPNAFAVSSKLLNYFQKNKIDGVGVTLNEIFQAKSLGYDERDVGQYKKVAEIFGATGGAALFNRQKFVKLGMFDPYYFMYYEEVDLDLRAFFAGFKSYLSEQAVIYHKHKASSSKKPQHLEYWQFKNMTITIIKDYPLSLMKKNWRWLKLILVHYNTIFYQLKNGYFWPPIMTELWIIWHLPSLIYKRNQVSSQKIVADSDLEKWLLAKTITFWGWAEKSKSEI